MSENYKQKCVVAKWFWLRAVLVIALLIGIAGYFFYDWKVGYPKKNQHLTQYETFEKARDYFMAYQEQDPDPKVWSAFAREQDLAYFKQRDIVAYEFRNATWPEILQSYDSYLSAYNAHSGESPVLWDEYLSKEVAYTQQLAAKATQSKDDRVQYENAIRWDLPLPSEIVKKAEEANYRLTMYRSFQQAQDLFTQHVAEGKSAAEWELLASCHDLAFPEDRSINPPQYQNEKWPEILADYDRYYGLASDDLATGVEVNKPYLWKEYTAEHDLGETPPDNFKELKKVNEQLYFGIGCLVVALLAGGYALRMKSRYMAVDDQAYYAPGGKKIPYANMYKIDKRKWDNKGLATLYYEEGSSKLKTRIDGMVYGQFKKEEGEPAQRLFDILLQNFKGELIDYEDVDPSTEDA